MKKTVSAPKSRRVNGAQSNGDGDRDRQILSALVAFKNGDFTKRLPDDWTGISGKIADAFN